jgi:SPP1 family predicted phage head-tail adaptor
VIGKLRERVTLQSEQSVSDGGGGQVVAWTDVATVWAAIEPLTGRERRAAGRLESVLTHKVTIRHLAGVTAKMRVAAGARVFNVRAVVNPAERDRWLELLCEEGVAT